MEDLTSTKSAINTEMAGFHEKDIDDFDKLQETSYHLNKLLDIRAYQRQKLNYPWSSIDEINNEENIDAMNELHCYTFRELLEQYDLAKDAITSLDPERFERTKITEDEDTWLGKEAYECLPRNEDSMQDKRAIYHSLFDYTEVVGHHLRNLFETEGVGNTNDVNLPSELLE